MKIVIFSGPSLPPSCLNGELDAHFLPPVGEGDVYRATSDGAQAIGIVDGYFENVPAVWHKEILHAMSRGVQVFGSASMGALRAAELALFGMEGVGSIYEAYRDGVLEDDDEVAVVHGPAEIGYPLLTEAMVIMRRTLSDAFVDGEIGVETHEALEAIGKALNYRQRTYAGMLKKAREENLPEDEVAAFAAWLPQGRVDQKREDSLLMLKVMREKLKQPVKAETARFHFEHTTLWMQAARRTAQADIAQRA